MAIYPSHVHRECSKDANSLRRPSIASPDVEVDINSVTYIALLCFQHVIGRANYACDSNCSGYRMMCEQHISPA